MKTETTPKTTSLYTQKRAALALGLSLSKLRQVFKKLDIKPSIGAQYTRADIDRAVQFLGVTIKD